MQADVVCANCGQLDDIRQLNRFREPPTRGAFWYVGLAHNELKLTIANSDLLWSDPVEDESVAFDRNTVRGCSYMFGYVCACS